MKPDWLIAVLSRPDLTIRDGHNENIKWPLLWALDFITMLSFVLCVKCSVDRAKEREAIKFQRV